MSDLDRATAALALRDRRLADQLLRALIRVPEEHVDRPVDQGGDPACGLSNHEGPRLELLRHALVELRAVRLPEDAALDAFGNLVWTVEDPHDGIPRERKRVVMFDGHTDTVQALRSEWRARLGAGLDPYRGLADPGRVDRDALRAAAGHLPPDSEWEHLVFGRGAADQLAGVVAQAMATRILLELADEGALHGVIVRSYATVAEEDNDGGGALYLKAKVWPGASPDVIPDVVILTEATGHAQETALGIYRGQRGRMQIEVVVTGRSCHGSMPWEGLNPFEHGGAMVAEAARRYEARQGFLDHPFLGHGTRTASWSRLETPSDCAVPERLTFRFDRRLTIGESPEQAVADVDGLDSVRAARAAGLTVEVGVPRYQGTTWRGYAADNPQVYPGWLTPEDHPACRAALAAYRGVVTPHVAPGRPYPGALSPEPRLSRWIFSTDGVGYPLPKDDRTIDVPEAKHWLTSGLVRHPAMIGIGPGHEQNAHRIGENVDLREVVHASALLARFPSAFAGSTGGLAA